jgi:hypothetical protein
MRTPVRVFNPDRQKPAPHHPYNFEKLFPQSSLFCTSELFIETKKIALTPDACNLLLSISKDKLA